jgi:hypothetical protein
MHILNPNNKRDGQIGFDPRFLITIQCPKCKCEAFLQGVQFLKSPSTTNSRGEDLVMGRDCIICVGCHTTFTDPSEIIKTNKEAH